MIAQFFPTRAVETVFRSAAALLVCLGLGGGASAQETSSSLPTVSGARVLTTPDRARLVMDLAAPTKFAIASLDLPDRIVVDVQAGALSFEAPRAEAGEGLVGEYEVAMAEQGRARATLYLTAPAQVQQAYVLEPFDDQPARLVVDLIPDTAERFAERVKQDLAASQLRGSVDSTEQTPPGQSNIASDARPLIVIDPGHGGIDSGAEAGNGIREKEIVLDFALELQRLLVEADRFDVALTRDDDSFLRLEERVALARENKADLFISIHADSFQEPTARGASVYTRDERATDVLDKVLAENENRADLIAGFDMPELEDEVVGILVDLMRRETRRKSYVAAQSLVDQLEPSVQLRRFPVRQADFFVLQAPEVPSVLLELGFLSNPDDIDNLTQGDWRDRTAAALARGITAYFDAQAQN